MEQHGLDRQNVVMPQGQPVEGVPMAREVRKLFVFRRIAVDDSGRRLPGERVGAFGAMLLRGVEEYFDVIGKQEVVVVEKIEPFAAGF